MFKNITLELSLKPFKKTDEVFIRGVCGKIFEQWRPVLRGRETISIMLWVGDGSEILDYAGNMKEHFEWGRFIGTANLPLLEEGEPLETSLHSKKQDYISNPSEMTYGVLRTIVTCLKEEGKKAFPQAVIRVGETFDIGPEFAISDFKYVRHPEICSGASVDKFGFVDATAVLQGDDRYYAAYPDGIPEGTHFGTFLGKQSAVFLKEMGFDYLWFSNGLGFSSNPWKKLGKYLMGSDIIRKSLKIPKELFLNFGSCFVRRVRMFRWKQEEPIIPWVSIMPVTVCRCMTSTMQV